MRVVFYAACLVCISSTVSLAQLANAQSVAATDSAVLTSKPVKVTTGRTDASTDLTMLKGKVIDENGSPLPGATLMIEGTNWITVTNDQGEYALPIQGVAAKAKVKCSFQGMADESVPMPDNKTNLVIRMGAGQKAASPATKGKPRDL